MSDDIVTLTLRRRLETLDPAELAELDAVITPRAAELLAKAFGPGIYSLLLPLTENDAPDGQPDRAQMEGALRRRMRDPRYWRDRDPGVITEVADGFRHLYPGQSGA